MICTRQASQETNRKWKNLQISNIHQLLHGAMPQPSGITLQFQDGLCQRGGPGGVGAQNDKEMHRDIHIQQKRKKKKRGGKKKTTLSLLPAPKSRSARILPHKR
jgi:hypothetical protein